VFISHTGQDKRAADFACALHERLKIEGIASFFDAQSLWVADLQEQRMVELVSGCQVFVAIVSPTYPLREWPLLELHLAVRANVPVMVPVLFEVERKAVKEPCEDWCNIWQQLQVGSNKQIAGIEGLSQKAARDAHGNLSKLLQSTPHVLGTGKAAPAQLMEAVLEACRVCAPAW
jgi:hypothetical protein